MSGGGWIDDILLCYWGSRMRSHRDGGNEGNGGDIDVIKYILPSSTAVKRGGHKVNREKLSKIKKLIDDVTYSPTKKDAQIPLRELEYISSTIQHKGEIDAYLAGKLNEVISFAKEASGRVRNKDHWISCVNQSWYVFENGVKKEE